MQIPQWLVRRRQRGRERAFIARRAAGHTRYVVHISVQYACLKPEGRKM